ncbi:17303_t:CDS:2 [Funneliformis geosporum]|uniref:17303_t:CDS:1 n=1 Tax=Funneliformis geosporum TaxID=1117311 RepID=A0A9W4SGE3_9GLOM|nr:17303_t:CDS:2 [Funneliformis geosporum]
MTSKFHARLSKDLLLLLNNANDHNVVIQVGKDQNVKEFSAHSYILSARSPYFKSAFSTEWVTKNNNVIEFKKPNINPNVFEMILNYIYAGEVDLSRHSGADVLGLLVASDELLFEELFNHVQDYLIEKLSTWVQQNFFLVLHRVFNLTNCEKLQNYCFESICSDPLPFISAEFFDKVHPYKSIFPKNIYEEMMESYMKNNLPKTTILPPRIGKFQIESKIVKPKLASVIINWINKKDANAIRRKEDPLYTFNLIYRGSQDGINNNSFRKKYDLQIPTLVLVKCQGSQKIFGGYSPIEFYNDDYGDRFARSTDCFIFSFENNEDTGNTKLSRVKSHYFNNAIYEYNAYNNTYGFNFGGGDLYTKNNYLYVGKSGFYEHKLIENNNPFTIEEIEAFSITKIEK